jgi:putative NIF3 family GTP cyclohydrolase 1 type 2
LPQLIFHTALDCCENGLNDMWRDHLRLKNTCQHFDGTLGWHGEIEPIQFSELVARVKLFSGNIFGETFNKKGMTDIIKTVVICSGLGGMVNELALATEADCYIIGQNTMPASSTGFKAVIETGHTASEWIGVNFFRKILAGVQVDLAPAEIDRFSGECFKAREYETTWKNAL